jgi:hypothetical protein
MSKRLEVCPACGKRGVTTNSRYLYPYRHCRYCEEYWAGDAAWDEANEEKESDT